MNTQFEHTKQNVINDLKQLIIEIESKKDAEFVRLLKHYKDEDNPVSVALCHMFYVDESRVNKYLKSLV